MPLDKIIQQQLDSLEVAKVDQYIEERHRYLFKQIKPVTLDVFKTYILRLGNSLLTKSTSSALANNWNHGTVPLHGLMKAKVMKKMGGMCLLCGEYLNELFDKIDGCEPWEGWVPQDEVTIMEEVK
jgi:hypothetical protein